MKALTGMSPSEFKILPGMSPSEFKILLITFEKILLKSALSKKRLRAVGGVRIGGLKGV